MIDHNHVTRDIKPVGECPACDAFHRAKFTETSPAPAGAAPHPAMEEREGTDV